MLACAGGRGPCGGARRGRGYQVVRCGYQVVRRGNLGFRCGYLDFRCGYLIGSRVGPASWTPENTVNLDPCGTGERGYLTRAEVVSPASRGGITREQRWYPSRAEVVLFATWSRQGDAISIERPAELVFDRVLCGWPLDDIAWREWCAELEVRLDA